MTKTKVLISGASVAGPALARFLHRDGYDVTVVERAPTLRESGYAVDFRGPALGVLTELGILDEVRRHETTLRAVALLDETGAEVGQLPAESFAGELEVPKNSLTRILHRITKDDVEFVFGDSVASLTDHGSRVEVTFEHGATREFDLVFGADGVLSNIRRLAFGPHSAAIAHLGMSGVGFTTANILGLDRCGLLRTVAGTATYLASTGDPERVTVSLSFGSDSSDLDRCGREEQEATVRAAFAGHGWEIPRLLDAMSQAEDYSFSSACQVDLDRWAVGRVALVGDAGYCAAPTSGMGTSQALIGAWTLARELATMDGDHTTAFPSYEAELRPYVRENQKKGREAATMFGGA
jgi:2-polyprenyl-6-methoxyphenol hydroxylase-like FAD-dependent oxidoreductase